MDNRLGFDLKSHVEVIDRSSAFFKSRGMVAEMPERDAETHAFMSDICKVKFGKDLVELHFSQVRNVQKKFIDIEHIREEDIDLGNGLVRHSNTGAFKPGDLIVIQEKIDGSNASISYNAEDEKLEVFSRTQLLNDPDGLRGFKQYIDLKFKQDDLKETADYVIFGEWLCAHKCQYFKDAYSRWYVYDIWSKSKREYLPQDAVRDFCLKHKIEYLSPLYEGPFISWEHCRSFMNLNPHGKQQEGVVVKSQACLSSNDTRLPAYLKIVNDTFRESVVKKEKKQLSPEKIAELERSTSLIKSVVTEVRVCKMMMKLVDEKILPTALTPECMGIAMKHLPKLIWEDIIKEEPDVVKAAGENASKLCSAQVASIAKKIILGK